MRTMHLFAGARGLAMNAKDYIERVKQMPCALCGASGPSDAHHPREGMGMSQRNSDWLAIPLCKDCHQGPHNGIHGERAMWKVMKKTELDLVAETFSSMIRACEKGYL